jgi:hypothetical protein
MRRVILSAGSLLMVAGLVIVFAAGCSGRKGPKLYPVKGMIYINGQPAKDVNVMFTPVTPFEDGLLLSPAAATDDDGSFRLTSFDPEDGAPAGEYLVTVIYPMSRFNKNLNGIDRLKGKYSDPKTSGLKATIEPKPNDLPAIQLKAELMPQQTAADAMKNWKKNRER